MLELALGLDGYLGMVALCSQRISGVQNHTNDIGTVDDFVELLPDSLALTSLDSFVLIKFPLSLLLELLGVNIIVLFGLIILESLLSLSSQLLQSVALYFGFGSFHGWSKSINKSLNIG